MKIIYFLTIFITLIILCYFIYLYIYNQNLEKIKLMMRDVYENNKTFKKTTPKILIQTYHDKSKIPNKVYKNIQKYASEYKHIIYDDEECIEFLKTNYNSLVVNKFKNFKTGAYKADLFRYCWLYKYGGVYMDIKIKPIKPLIELFTKNKLYTVLSNCGDAVFQGIISTPPNNPIFKPLINKILNSSEFELWFDYQIFTRHFFQELKNIDNYKLFKEKCDDKLNSDLKPDRYNLRCAIYDHNERVFITRYPEYPW